MNPTLALTILGLFLFALAGALSFAQPPRQLTPEQQEQLQAQQELSAQSVKNIASNHSAHAWRWFQVAYAYDAEGLLAGVRYDAATLTKVNGKGKWWEGLDPQELYCGFYYLE